MSGDRDAGGALHAGCRLLGSTENDFSSHDRLQDLYLTNLRGFDGENILAEQDHIGELAGRDRSFLFVLKFRVGRTHGVGLDRLRYAHLLLWKPAARSLTVQSSASDSRVDG